VAGGAAKRQTMLGKLLGMTQEGRGLGSGGKHRRAYSIQSRKRSEKGGVESGIV